MFLIRDKQPLETDKMATAGDQDGRGWRDKQPLETNEMATMGEMATAFS